MNYFLLSVSVLLGTGKNMVSKYTGNKFSGLPNLLKNNIVTAMLAIIVFSIQGFRFSFLKNPVAIILSVLYGIFIMLSQIFLIKAVEYSATGICSLIYSMGFIIPTLFSVIVLSEPLGILKIIGLLLIILSFIFVANVKSSNTKKLYFAFLAMVTSGIIGIIQKLIAFVPEKYKISEYLTVAFLVMLICSIVGYYLTKKKSNKKEISKEFLITAVLMGICVAFPNFINTRLAGKMPGIVFFTCVNGGTIILSCIASLFLFREKLKPMQLFGISLGISAIILLVL